MSEKTPDKKPLRDSVMQRYVELTGQPTRRELLLTAGSFLGGVGVALAAMKSDMGGLFHGGEKERRPRIVTGIDFSYPQKMAERYDGQSHDFVIVGVNGGMPTIPNEYLVRQLAVARELTTGADPAQTGMAPIQIYLNTANPADFIGTDHLKSWPSDGEETPYGICDGSDSRACMYAYGLQRAEESIESIFLPAARDAGLSETVADYMVWLDVENYNSWREHPKREEDSQESNVAVLEGMAAYLQSLGAGVGLYAARGHWDEIIGDSVKADSNLYALPTWLAIGTTSEENAKAVLLDEDQEPFVGGGRVMMIQRVEGESADDENAQDYNYAVAP